MHDYNFTPHKYISDYPEGCCYFNRVKRGDIIALIMTIICERINSKSNIESIMSAEK